MASASSPDVPVAKTYPELRQRVESAYLSGKRAADEAAIRSAWLIGQLIERHVLLFQERADYGAKTIRRLAADTKISRRVLYRCLQLGRRYQIVPTSAQLTCAHFMALSRLEDGPPRKAMTIQAEKQGWNSLELEKRVSAVAETSAKAAVIDGNGASDSRAAVAPVRLLLPKRGIVGRYLVVSRRGGLAVDLGFKVYVTLRNAGSAPLKPGTIVGPVGTRMAPISDATAADLFTYRALDVRVVDGDTLAVQVDLPPDNETDKKLRLRGLDCPEMNTSAGKAAKRFVQEQIDAAEEIIIVTSKVDKYDRYLADVYLRQRSGGEIFLNNALLENGHAVRMNPSAQENWIP
jgi:endonuclease YncB( thermonuclease family)